MLSEININGIPVVYELCRKKVKNINLRIKPDGSVYVSANKMVPGWVIDEFLLSKSEFILKAKEKYKSKALPKKYFTEEEIKEVILSFCEKAYPYYSRLGVAFPSIKFRKMVSRWGSCQPAGGVLTFNTNLMFAPGECVEYVVWHEFTHFLQENHSALFYAELEKVCPDWKERRKRLKEIYIR